MPQRLKKKNHHEFMLGVRLFRDDLATLCEMIGEDTAIVVDNVRFDTLDELSEHHGDIIHELQLGLIDPLDKERRFTVFFRAGVSISADEMELTFRQVQDFLKCRIHWAGRRPWLIGSFIFIVWTVIGR